MTRQQFETLVRNLERSSKQQPQTYQLGVFGLALLGYFYIFLILALLIALVGGLAAGSFFLIVGAHGASLSLIGVGKFIIPAILGLLSFIGVILRSLRVHFDAPEGIILERQTAPQLFVMLDEVCRKLKAPRFHHVMLDDDFNAGVLQVPRFGVFGWQTNYLLLGLPLMLALSPEQFRAVLAHEVGHLSGNHGRFGGWIYRIRRTWGQMLGHLEAAQHGGVSLLVPFVRWYAPYFSAYTFVLARAHEYVADRCSAEVCGAETAAQALIVTQIKGSFFANEFWSRLFDQARDQPEPPANLINLLGKSFQVGLSDREAAYWYEQALEERTGTGDTHPALAERLAALGFRGTPGGPLDLPRPPMPLPPVSENNAAQAYLGAMLGRYAAPLERQWRAQVAPGWREAYQKSRAAESRLESLDRLAAQEQLTSEEVWERAAMTAQMRGHAEAMPLLQALVADRPSHAPANYLLGQALLAQENHEGIEYLKRAADADPEARASSFHSIAQFLRRQGKTAEAAQYLHLARQTPPTNPAAQRPDSQRNTRR